MSAVRTAALLEGIAQHLDAEGVADWPTTGAPVTKMVTLKALPATPDLAVSLSVYDVEDDLRLPHVVLFVQARCRGTSAVRTSVDDLADDVFDALHGQRFTAGGYAVQQCRRISVAPLGADDNGRHERADNYELVVSR